MKNTTDKPNNTHGKWLIISLTSLLLLIAGATLVGLEIGTVDGRPSDWVMIPSILSLISFIISLVAWLVTKFKKWAILPITCLILIIIAIPIIYRSKQRKNACNAIYDENLTSQEWLENWKQKSNYANSEVNSLIKFSKDYSNAPKIVSNYETLIGLNKEFYNRYKMHIDIYSKYLNVFTTYDLSGTYDSLQNYYESIDVYYAFLANTFKNPLVIMKNKESQKIYIQEYENINTKMIKAQEDFSSAEGAVIKIENIFSFRCYQWFKMKF